MHGTERNSNTNFHTIDIFFAISSRNRLKWNHRNSKKTQNNKRVKLFFTRSTHIKRSTTQTLWNGFTSNILFLSFHRRLDLMRRTRYHTATGWLIHNAGCSRPTVLLISHWLIPYVQFVFSANFLCVRWNAPHSHVNSCAPPQPNRKT